MSEKKVLAIVVTYNAMHWIERCLTRLRDNKAINEILVIDNNSADGTVLFIRANYVGIKVFETAQNNGFGKANNLGLKYFIEQQATYALLINQDVYVQPDSVQNLLAFHAINPEYGIMSPLHLNSSETELDDNFAGCVSRNLKELQDLEKSGIKCVDVLFVNAAAWLLSRDCILKTGGFDPVFLHYGEDRDYCNRALYHGFKIGVVLNSWICHDRKYDENNRHRSLENNLYSSGLAYFKNINRSLGTNLISWSFKRLVKTLKAILLLKTERLGSEARVSIKLLNALKQVRLSRKICETEGLTFLE